MQFMYRRLCINLHYWILPNWSWIVASFAAVVVEDQMPLEERQNLRVDTDVLTPDSLSPRPVILFRLLNNAKFIQLMGQGLIGIDMILIQIAAGPVKLEPSQRLQIVSILGNHRLQKKVVA